MVLGDFYLHDPRVTLLPIEHLSPAGLEPSYRAWLEGERERLSRHLALFDRAFRLYWQRSSDLAGRTRTWPAPRLRHVAVVRDGLTVHPYAPMLNTSAWTLYEVDLDPDVSHPELAAFLLAHQDRLAMTGEVTLAAVHTAPWWFERSEEECAAFAAAAEGSTRPDADGFRAIANALPWLRQLRHETLQPAQRIALPGLNPPAYRPVPGSGLLVPAAIEEKPPILVDLWKRDAEAAVSRYHHASSARDPDAVRNLLAWLESDAPPLLITGRRETILWDPDEPARLGALRQDLRDAGGAAARDVAQDLATVVRHSRAFLDSLADRTSLPPRPITEPEQRGYAYMHRQRRLIAYNLHEQGIERLLGRALPYARAMVGARTAHEWCHLAVDGGCVPQVASPAAMDQILGRVADLLEAARRDAPLAARLTTSSGRALADGLVDRFTDYRANLLAQRYFDSAERETYVRHNIRTLRGQYPPADAFRMLVRYLYEYQYLRFSAVADRRSFFLRSTWFDDDFFRPRLLDESRFEALIDAVGAICDAYAVDENRFVTGDEQR